MTRHGPAGPGRSPRRKRRRHPRPRHLLRGLVLLACPLAPPGMLAPAAHATADHVHCRLPDPRLTEASSLVDLGRWLVTANDSGHAARIFVLDARSCATVGVTRYAATADDVEAMAPAGPHAVWVGDLGDNRRDRDSITVHRVPVAAGDHRLTAPGYTLTYPDGPHDAEALVRDGRRLYVVTKGVVSGAVYAAPARLSATAPNRLRRVAAVPATVTDAALLESGRAVLLRDYSRAYLLTLPGWRLRGSFALPHQRQGEAISVGPSGRVLVTSEGAGARVLRVRVPDRLLAGIGPPDSPSAAPTPAAGTGRHGDEGSRGPTGSPVPLVVLAAVVIAVSWGLRRLRRSRTSRRSRHPG